MILRTWMPPWPPHKTLTILKTLKGRLKYFWAKDMTEIMKHSKILGNMSCKDTNLSILSQKLKNWMFNRQAKWAITILKRLWPIQNLQLKRKSTIWSKTQCLKSSSSLNQSTSKVLFQLLFLKMCSKRILQKATGPRVRISNNT
jgi:hypothetical protein